jgi:predicted Zn-dependent protease
VSPEIEHLESDMSKTFYKLGKKVGPGFRKAKWIWETATNSPAEALKVEYEVGRDMAYDVRHRFGLASDPETKRFLDEVGRRLADCVGDELRTFRFESIKDYPVQAFCLPGGFVFASRSLVQWCRSDNDEIAFVLGHEMAHVVRGHVMERMISGSAIAAASHAAAIRSALTSSFRKVGVKLLQSAYSRGQELEADILAVRLLTAAGYDPRGSIRFLSRMAKSADKAPFGDYFSSHPQCEVRIEKISRFLGENGSSNSEMA